MYLFIKYVYVVKVTCILTINTDHYCLKTKIVTNIFIRILYSLNLPVI